MRFLHLADLHIGKRLNEFSLIEDQKFIFDKILNIIDEKKLRQFLLQGMCMTSRCHQRRQ